MGRTCPFARALSILARWPHNATSSARTFMRAGRPEARSPTHFPLLERKVDAAVSTGHLSRFAIPHIVLEAGAEDRVNVLFMSVHFTT